MAAIPKDVPLTATAIDAESLSRVKGSPADASSLTARLRQAMRPLPAPEDPAFAEAFDTFADARVVLLGEATHGTSEFYRARAAISRRLIDCHGFRIVAIEGDWPDVAELDRFVRNRETWGQHDSFVNFPRWMWRNAEFQAFVHALRAANLHRPPEQRTELRGLDVYSMRQSLARVVTYLDAVDPKAAGEARRRYACLAPFLDAPQRYGAAARFGSADCEDQVVSQLVELLHHRHRYQQDHDEGFFDAAQNAQVVRAAEAYYRAMYRGSTESWNLRDSHMFATLERLLEARGPDAKAIVWAHNSHIGNAAATAMGMAGEFNIGELCRRRFGRDCVAIGFSTDRGEVAAADAWDGPVTIKTIRPSRPESWERHLRDAGIARGLAVWRDDRGLRPILCETRLERAIGVVYRPDTERQSHYFEARLGDQFDALVWFEETSAVSPLPGAPPEGAPDIFPFGV